MSTIAKINGINLPASSGGGGGSNSICDGRLTLETGVPVSITDQTAKTTIYFTPYKGNKIALYDGVSAWSVLTFSELSVAVPATTSTPFDIFCYDNAGTPTLETVNWTNDTTRATALTLQDGVLVKTGATTRRYLGTGRTTTVSGQCEDSYTKRYLWNYYNRVRKSMSRVDTTNSWNYTTATWRQANNSTINQLDAVIGVAEIVVSIVAYGPSYNAGSVGRGTGVGVDSTSVNSAQIINAVEGAGGKYGSIGTYKGMPAAGRHYFAWLEYSEASGTTIWFGDNNYSYIQSGISGELEG